ncbi:hydrogenase maturation protease, partial [Frankia sp. AgW1.1]|uniref:hydrogenase maturation protease n=1 Tax=Frankia sp. AgW1.1 TaxID=1836971 RepID=UPI0019348B13
MTRTLVAGVGNVLLGDDGFGVAVVGRLAAGPQLPPGVTVADYGIAGTHLAFDAAGGCDELLLIDAVPPWPVSPPGGPGPRPARGRAARAPPRGRRRGAPPPGPPP